ncbi:MAG TPA: hypothetical protein VH814_18505 [Steroidobacteraceae bacterium]|jgi:hypothetical protein
MSAESPRWESDPASATVLMEYLKRVSPEFVAAELDELGLLDAADRIAAAKFGAVARPRASRAGLWMVALAMCAVVAVVIETRHLGALGLDDGSQFMQLAGPTAEW